MNNEVTVASFVVEHWGKFATGILVIIGFIHRTGQEHQKYQDLRCRVSTIEDNCDDRLATISTMNSNLCRIMGALGIQPIDEPPVRKHRKED